MQITDKPKDLKAIDWENYNDVYTVYWNELSPSFYAETKEGKEIKVCGYIFQGELNPSIDFTDFILLINPKDIFSINPVYPNLFVHFIETEILKSEEFVEALKSKFTGVDFTKKCFVKGMLTYHAVGVIGCWQLVPSVLIDDIDDIYFEE